MYMELVTIPDTSKDIDEKNEAITKDEEDEFLNKIL